MDDLLTKPIRPAELIAAIDRVAPARNVSQEARPVVGEHLRLLDPAAAPRACGEDKEALRTICRGLQTYLPERLAEVRDALRDSDSPRLRSVAHKLCALLFEFSTAAGNVASDLEDYAAEGRLEEAQPLVQQLETMADEMLRLSGGLSIEALRQQIGPADAPNRT